MQCEGIGLNWIPKLQAMRSNAVSDGDFERLRDVFHHIVLYCGTQRLCMRRLQFRLGHRAAKDAQY